MRKHRENIAAGTEQLPQDPQLYWARMRPICATRLADVAVDLLTCPATSVPSERLFSVAGVMCAGEQSIQQEINSYFLLKFFLLGKKHSISDENLERRVLLKCNLDTIME